MDSIKCQQEIIYNTDEKLQSWWTFHSQDHRTRAINFIHFGVQKQHYTVSQINCIFSLRCYGGSMSGIKDICFIWLDGYIKMLDFNVKYFFLWVTWAEKMSPEGLSRRGQCAKVMCFTSFFRGCFGRSDKNRNIGVKMAKMYWKI